MKELNVNQINHVVGAGEDDPNVQIISDLGNNVAWGAGLGAVTGGPTGALIGGVGGAVQTVGQGLIDHGPVSVPVDAMIGPSWNGSSGMTFCEMKGMVGGESGC